MKGGLLDPIQEEGRGSQRKFQGAGGVYGSGYSDSGRMSHGTSPNRGSVYDKIREGKYTYEQTKQILMAQGKTSNRKDKRYNPNAKQHRDISKLAQIGKNNDKYTSLYHGASQYGSSRFQPMDRDRVWSVRPANPMVMSGNIAEIPMQLSRRFDTLEENDIIYESELMKYKPGIRHQYMSRWCQVTKTHFLYFADGLPYASYLSRPLAIIPLD